MKIVVIQENERRKIVVVKDEPASKSSYYWIDQNGLIEYESRFQEKETILHLSKEKLQELFPGVHIIFDMKRTWDPFKEILRIMPKQCLNGNDDEKESACADPPCGG